MLLHQRFRLFDLRLPGIEIHNHFAISYSCLSNPFDELIKLC
uniref:Uncharacterized protein n=1 Tax=Ascaris lumbricoides TaxID=6252 RepID=A0A0M3IT38_ASCLU